MITINQYVKLLYNFFSQHDLINTVLVGNEYDFNAESDIVYPVANIEYVTQNIVGSNITHQFEITIADLFDPNLPKSEYRLYSDANQIADDTLTYFENQVDSDYDVDDSISVQKFTNGNDDRTAGCVFVITFNQWRNSDDCTIPINISTEYDNGSFGEIFTDTFW